MNDDALLWSTSSLAAAAAAVTNSSIGIELSQTEELYIGSGTEDLDGRWAVTGGPVVSLPPWWPDEAPWFRILLIVLYSSVFAGCVMGNKTCSIAL